MAKITFVEIPNPDVDPAGFVMALNENFETIRTTLLRVADRTSYVDLDTDMTFKTPDDASFDTKAAVMNGTVKTVVL